MPTTEPRLVRETLRGVPARRQVRLASGKPRPARGAGWSPAAARMTGAEAEVASAALVLPSGGGYLRASTTARQQTESRESHLLRRRLDPKPLDLVVVRQQLTGTGILGHLVPAVASWTAICHRCMMEPVQEKQPSRTCHTVEPVAVAITVHPVIGGEKAWKSSNPPKREGGNRHAGNATTATATLAGSCGRVGKGSDQQSDEKHQTGKSGNAPGHATAWQSIRGLAEEYRVQACR